MGKQFGYKKYMKKDVKNDASLLKIFIISFFGMLLIFTFLIKSFSPKVDTSIGEYKSEENIEDNYSEQAVNVDDRLQYLQNEDQGRSFSEIVKSATDENVSDVKSENSVDTSLNTNNKELITNTNVENNSVQKPVQEPIYKVYVGSYTSAEQAKVAKDIILESGSALNPIVKCIGSNDYTLQVGIFKNKKSAETLLYTVQQSNLPGRIVQDY